MLSREPLGGFLMHDAMRVLDTSRRPQPRQNSSHHRLIFGRVLIPHDAHRIVSSQDIEHGQTNIAVRGPDLGSLSLDALPLELLPVPSFGSIHALTSVPPCAWRSDPHPHAWLLSTSIDTYDARNAKALSCSVGGETAHRAYVGQHGRSGLDAGDEALYLQVLVRRVVRFVGVGVWHDKRRNVQDFGENVVR